MTEEHETDYKCIIRDWIIERSKAPDAPLTYDTPIIDNGHLDSVDVLELILLIEELSGEEVDTADLDPDSFRSVNAIHACFVAPHL